MTRNAGSSAPCGAELFVFPATGACKASPRIVIEKFSHSDSSRDRPYGAEGVSGGWGFFDESWEATGGSAGDDVEGNQQILEMKAFQILQRRSFPEVETAGVLRGGNQRQLDARTET